MHLFSSTSKPFLKWAGGKTQLIEDIKRNFPKNFLKDNFTFIEPFVGSGAVLFWVLNNFPNAQRVIINDVNKDLIGVYETIKNNPNELIDILDIFQKEFHSFNQNEEKKDYYNDKRKLFNLRNSDALIQSALFIFLNKTCFNGLYRVNRKNEYNVPMGSYTKPLICDKENILAVNIALQNVEILCGDYQQTLEYADENTLFYFDPPYKPLNETSSFNSYVENNFDDKEQIRLRDFCKKIDKLGYSWILSNSDMKNVDESNNFFDELYSGFDIKRVDAKRSINSKGNKRGKITELLISNIKNDSYERAI